VIIEGIVLKGPGNTSILRLNTDNSVIHHEKDKDKDNVNANVNVKDNAKDKDKDKDRK
jgi:hypothetical protein